MQVTSFLRRLTAQTAIALCGVLLGVVLLAFSERQNINDVLKVGGAALFAAGLSMLLGGVSSREAVRSQNAKDARLLAKRDIYSPLYVQLKALRRRLDDAEHRTAPYPLGIKLDDSEIRMPRDGYLPIIPELDFTFREQCKQDTRELDFTPQAAEVLNGVLRSANEYNLAVKDARTATVGILTAHIQSAIQSEQAKVLPDGIHPWLTWYANYEDQRRRPGSSSDRPLENKWYAALVDNNAAEVLATTWETGATYAMNSTPHTLGWLLARKTDKAAETVLASYTKETYFFTAPQAWVKACLDAALPDLKAHKSYRAVWSAFEPLLRHVHSADAMILKALRDIREEYEGIPLV